MQYFIFTNGEEIVFESKKEAKNYAITNNVAIVTSYCANTPKIRYVYRFNNGEQYEMNEVQMRLYCVQEGAKVVSGGPLRFQKTDMYEGYNWAFGKYISGRREYREELKKRNCIEVGTEDPNKLFKKEDKNYVDDKLLKDAVERGAEIGGVEADALKNGINLHSNYEDGSSKYEASFYDPGSKIPID